MAERTGNETIQSDRLDAVIFDLDGVITKTAAVHEVAWAEMFDRYLARTRRRDRHVVRTIHVRRLRRVR